MGGTAHNFDMPLTIRQRGEETLDFNASYDLGGTGAGYYAWRLGAWRGDHAWEIEHLHHKLLLANGPPEVQDFQISHGFNMFLYNTAHRADGLIHHLGAGLVVTHAENTVRGRELGQSGGFLRTGYRLSGVAAQYALGKQFPIGDRLFATLEGKLTAGWVSVPVVDGEAEVWNLAAHALLGIGYEF
jgi:hypothetical protein